MKMEFIKNVFFGHLTVVCISNVFNFIVVIVLTFYSHYIGSLPFVKIFKTLYRKYLIKNETNIKQRYFCKNW